MGCGASAAKPCTTEQKTVLCASMGKEMMLLCIGPALDKFDQIKVPAPPEVARLRENVASLRMAAKKQTEDAGSAPAPKEEEAGKQGMLGGMLSKAGDMVGKAAEAVGGVIDSATESTLNAMADQLEKVVNEIEAPFLKVGQEIVEAKKDKIKTVFESYIGNLPLKDVGLKLCRGDEPHGFEEYGKAPGDALTDFLCRKSAKNLVAQLMPVCEEAIKQHTVTKTWDAVIENYNSFNAKIAAGGWKDLALKPIELDIKDYIVTQCVEQIALLMAKEEAERRKSPAQSGRTRTPNTFDAVFSGNQLGDTLFNRYSNGKDV